LSHVTIMTDGSNGPIATSVLLALRQGAVDLLSL
jgi:hypothetical protein